MHNERTMATCQSSCRLFPCRAHWEWCIVAWGMAFEMFPFNCMTMSIHNTVYMNPFHNGESVEVHMLFLQVTAKLPSSAVEATPPLFPMVYVTTTILSTPVSCKYCMLGRMCKVVWHMNIAREFPCKNKQWKQRKAIAHGHMWSHEQHNFKAS